MAVADGMGGHNAGGGFASEIAISNISRKWGKLESMVIKASCCLAKQEEKR